jgi:O-antigen/teichoic acid export membrane protein
LASLSSIPFLSRPMVYGSLIPVVILLNALVGMLLPTMMTPRVFGEYSLAVTLFQYGLIFDSGTGQLIDRWLPPALARGEFAHAERLGQRLMWVRLYIGVAVFAVAGTILIGLAVMGRLPFGLGAGLLSAGAGILYMLALGPGFIYRAHSARRNYAVTSVILSLGLVIARPAGLLAGGVIGCFLALTAWYLASACLYYWRTALRLSFRPPTSEVLSLAVQGIPFFATSFIWAFYVTANRWFASRLMDPGEFGHFAFGTNIFSLLIGAAAGLNAFYYPRIVGRIANEGRFALSRQLTIDFTKVMLAIGAVIGVGIILTPFLLKLIYPQYYQSVNMVRILLAAVPLMVLVAWIMPISLSSGHRPWIDGVLVYPIATAILFIAIHSLTKYYGNEGTAAASIISAFPLAAMLLVQLRLTHILKTSAVMILLGVAALTTSALCALIWGIT